MPVIEIKSIGPRLDQTDKYIKNEEKTDVELWEHMSMGSTYEDALQSVYNYTTQENKTKGEKQYFISGINCDPSHSVEEFRQIQELYGKWGDGITAHHGWLSFPKGYIITPQECHDFAKELLTKELGDRFQIVVTTHVDREHVHSHFLINAVSFKDGKKYLGNQETLWKLRRASDELCLKYGYPIIENPSFYGRDRGEYRAELRGERTWRDLVKMDIDRAIALSDTMKDFYAQLESQGYLLKIEGRKHPAISPPGMVKKNGDRIYIRLRSLNDNAYSLAGIESRIVYHRLNPEPTIVYLPRRYTGKPLPRPKKRLPVYVRRYYRLMYSVGLMPKKPRNLSYYKVKALQKQAAETNEVIKYIKRMGFSNESEVYSQLASVNSAIRNHESKRSGLYKRSKRGDDVQTETKEHTDKLKECRAEKKLLEKVILIIENGDWKTEKKQTAKPISPSTEEQERKRTV